MGFSRQLTAQDGREHSNDFTDCSMRGLASSTRRQASRSSCSQRHPDPRMACSSSHHAARRFRWRVARVIERDESSLRRSLRRHHATPEQDPLKQHSLWDCRSMTQRLKHRMSAHSQGASSEAYSPYLNPNGAIRTAHLLVRVDGAEPRKRAKCCIGLQSYENFPVSCQALEQEQSGLQERWVSQASAGQVP